MFYTSITLIQWLLLFEVAFVSYMLGRDMSRHETENVIEQTILTLIQKRYVRAKRINGEYELFEYDDENNSCT